MVDSRRFDGRSVRPFEGWANILESGPT